MQFFMLRSFDRAGYYETRLILTILSLSWRPSCGWKADGSVSTDPDRSDGFFTYV